MGFLKKLFTKKTKTDTSSSIDEANLHYFINVENEVYGPFSLSELKSYPIMEDTLITTNTLDEWYEAKYFECFDDIFTAQRGFRINEFGEIVRK